MKASKFLSGVAFFLALAGVLSCGSDKPKGEAEETSGVDEFESADWQLYNLRGRVKSCVESKVSATLVGEDELEPTDERPQTATIKFDADGWLLSLAYYRRTTTSRDEAEQGVSPFDKDLIIRVTRDCEGRITEFAARHKRYGEDYDGTFHLQYAYDGRGNAVSEAYTGWEWGYTTTYKYDAQDHYAEMKSVAVDLEEEDTETARVKVVETDGHGNWTKAYLFVECTNGTYVAEEDKMISIPGEDKYYILTREITYWE